MKPTFFHPEVHGLALISFFLAKVQLSFILTFFSLTIWCSELTALFLFLLARVAPAYFSAGSVCSGFLLKPEPFCTLFAHLDSTNKSATSILFSFYLTLVLSSPSCPFLHLFFYLNFSGGNCLLSPVLSGYNGSPDTRFSRGTTRQMSWSDGEHFLRPLESLVVSLLFLISTLVFSRTGGVLSHRNSSTHRFPRFPPRNLCSLVMLTVFSFVYAATDTAFC